MSYLLLLHRFYKHVPKVLRESVREGQGILSQFKEMSRLRDLLNKEKDKNEALAKQLKDKSDQILRLWAENQDATKQVRCLYVIHCR